MRNFDYSIPTRIFFGEGKIDVLGKELAVYGSKVLMVYGGSSIVKSGLYDVVISKLKEHGIRIWELPGVEPNPRIATVEKGIALCREHGIDAVLAVGGGSTIDCAKVVAAGCHNENDAWTLVKKPKKIGTVLPIATVLTLAATGTEMDQFAVISNPEINEKIGTGHPAMFPKFSILDPTYTFSVPASQTAAGTVDIMSHVMEVYFSNPKEAFLPDRMSESLLLTCIRYGKKAMEEPNDYEARANLMWASSLAINGLLSYGKEQKNWCVHPIEHELSAYYDITHGVGLGIIIPVWLDYILDASTVEKFVEYGVNVWGIEKGEDAMAIAKESIRMTRSFFDSLGIPNTLSAVGIDETHFEAMATGSVRNGEIGGIKRLNKEDVLNLLKRAL